MSTNLDAKPTAEPFRAVLMPYRSLGPQGFVILMSAIGVVSFVAGAVFLYLGAWPVFAFFGLDAVLIYLAFKLNYRSGREYELVELTPEALTVTRVHPSGTRELFDFNPYWTKVRLREHVDGRTDLRLIAQGRELVFARFLTDSERREFANALTIALMSARTVSGF